LPIPVRNSLRDTAPGVENDPPDVSFGFIAVT